jgi:hypothetical protein
MLPLFRFELSTMALRSAVRTVLREHAPVMSDWEICLWFAASNAWLAEASPLNTIGGGSAGHGRGGVGRAILAARLSRRPHAQPLRDQ